MKTFIHSRYSQKKRGGGAKNKGGHPTTGPKKILSHMHQKLSPSLVLEFMFHNQTIKQECPKIRKFVALDIQVGVE